MDQYDIQRAKTKFGFPKDRAAPAKSVADLAASVGLTMIDNIPASAIKAGASAKHPAPTKPKAPVPPFNSNASSTNVNTTATKTTTNPHVAQTPGVHNPLVSQQTPSVPSAAKPVFSAERSGKAPVAQQQAPPFAGRVRPPPPFASREQPPPPTSTQGLQSSSLFKLSQFAAGNNTAPVQTEAAKPAHDENIPPIDFDALDRERPSTSTGHKPPAVGALIAPSNAGNKRALEVTESQSSRARKAPNVNPYRASM